MTLSTPRSLAETPGAKDLAEPAVEDTNPSSRPGATANTAASDTLRIDTALVKAAVVDPSSQEAVPLNLVSADGAVPEQALVVVRCLGSLRVHARGEPGGQLIEITAGLSPKIQVLLARMATRPDGVPADTLMEAAWPDTPLTQATGRMQTTLTYLRRALRKATSSPDARFATFVTNRYHLGAQAGDPRLWVDYWAFRDALAATRTHLDHARIEAGH
jgi:hypothetical protein